MGETIGIYVLNAIPRGSDYILDGIRQLKACVDGLVLIVPKDLFDTGIGLDPFIKLSDSVVVSETWPNTIIEGYRAGLLKAVHSRSDNVSTVVMCSSAVFGPLRDPRTIINTLDQRGDSAFFPYFFKPDLDPRTKMIANLPELMPLMDFVIFGKELIKNEAFWSFWRDLKTDADYWQEFLSTSRAMSDFLKSAGARVSYGVDPSSVETSDCRIYEFDSVAQQKSIVLPTAIFKIDPVLHDLQALNTRLALDHLRDYAPDHYSNIVRHIVLTTPLRDLHCINDEVFVLDDLVHKSDRKSWSFGSVGVFVHAFYANMIEEFWILIARMPKPYKIYVSTAADSHREMICDFLLKQGLTQDEFDVRVVEANRGRDMSSLFITFRDVIMAEEHQLCLRLHSKRTPQVSRQVGTSFKNHLFDNLAPSTRYIENLYDLIEENPEIGLAMPPTIHIGFATLGHSWFNNRGPFDKIVHEMGLDVPIDPNTPLAPYGTMYWFRSDALRRMFEWEWRWDQYNQEPMHVDGGLAHVQERLIPYVVQDKGYRVISIMTPQSAARNYAKLEYKLQRIASHLPNANIMHQLDYLGKNQIPGRLKIREKLIRYYQNKIMSRPWLHKIAQPIAQKIGKLLS